MPFPDGHALLIGVGAYDYLPRWDALTTVHDGVSHLAPQGASGMRFPSAEMALECSAAESNLIAPVQGVYLRETLPRLLILDNCEDELLLAAWRPPHGGRRETYAACAGCS